VRAGLLGLGVAAAVAGACGRIDYDPVGAARDLDARVPLDSATDGSIGSRDGSSPPCGLPMRYDWDRPIDGYTSPRQVAQLANGDWVSGATFRGTVDFGGGPRAAVGAPGADNVAIWALDGDSGYRWDRTYAAGRCAGVAIDSTGGVVSAGQFFGDVELGGGLRTSGGVTDAFVVALDGVGGYRWDHTYGGAGSEWATAIGVLPSGTTIVVIQFDGQVDFGGGPRTSTDGPLAIVALGSDGSYEWDRTVGPGAGVIYVWKIAADAGGFVLAGGFFGATDFGGGARGSSSGEAVLVLALGPDGSYRWDRTYPNGSAFGLDARETARGSLTVVTGNIAGTPDFGGGARSLPATNGFAVGLAPDGSYLWDRTYPTSNASFVDDAWVSDCGDVVLSGHFWDGVDFGGGARRLRRRRTRDGLGGRHVHRSLDSMTAHQRQDAGIVRRRRKSLTAAHRERLASDSSDFPSRDARPSLPWPAWRTNHSRLGASPRRRSRALPSRAAPSTRRRSRSPYMWSSNRLSASTFGSARSRSTCGSARNRSTSSSDRGRSTFSNRSDKLSTWSSDPVIRTGARPGRPGTIRSIRSEDLLDRRACTPSIRTAARPGRQRNLRRQSDRRGEDGSKSAVKITIAATATTPITTIATTRVAVAVVTVAGTDHESSFVVDAERSSSARRRHCRLTHGARERRD